MRRDMWQIAEQMDRDLGAGVYDGAVSCDEIPEGDKLDEYAEADRALDDALYESARWEIRKRLLAGERPSMAMGREFSYFPGLVEVVSWEVFTELRR